LAQRTLRELEAMVDTPEAVESERVMALPYPSLLFWLSGQLPAGEGSSRGVASAVDTEEPTEASDASVPRRRGVTAAHADTARLSRYEPGAQTSSHMLAVEGVVRARLVP
jgi:hypothetical protein